MANNCLLTSVCSSCFCPLYAATIWVGPFNVFTAITRMFDYNLYIVCYLCEGRWWFQLIGYNYTTCMDFMEPDVCCPQKAIKLNHSSSHGSWCKNVINSYTHSLYMQCCVILCRFDDVPGLKPDIFNTTNWKTLPCSWLTMITLQSGHRFVWSIFPYSSGLHQQHWGNHMMIAPMSVK